MSHDRVSICQQCFEEYQHGSHTDGFCSDYCLDKYEKQLVGEDEEEEEEEDTEEEE